MKNRYRKAVSSRSRITTKAIARTHSYNSYDFTIIFILLLASIVITSIMMSQAYARPVIDAATQAQINSQYEELMKNPTDRDLNLQYSTLVAKAGDFEAAIPPLERILVNEPENAWLLVQLGTLYKSLNSTVMARTYLYKAIQSPNADLEMVAKAKALLASL